MAYYNICSRCGAHLDPGERCDCESERVIAEMKMQRWTRVDEKTKQIMFNFEEAENEKAACY